MSGPLGFPAFGLKQPYRPGQDAYAGGNQFYRRNRNSLFGEFAKHQTHAHSPMFGGHSSPFGRMGGVQSPFAGLGGMNFMVGYPTPGFSSPLRMGIGMGSGMHLGAGMGVGIGFAGQPPMTRRSPMAYPRSSPFGRSSPPRTHASFGHRHSRYPSWPRTRRSPFSSPYFDDDDPDDDDDYDMLSMYGFPNQRRNGFRQYRHLPYGRLFGGNRLDEYDDYDDDYDEFEDFDEDDEEDFDEYLEARQWQRY